MENYKNIKYVVDLKKIIIYNEYVYDLNRLGCPLKDAHVLIIGAGGAAKGILKPIIESGIKKITIVNRTVSKALDLAVFYPGSVDGTSYENLTGS